MDGQVGKLTHVRNFEFLEMSFLSTILNPIFNYGFNPKHLLSSPLATDKPTTVKEDDDKSSQEDAIKTCLEWKHKALNDDKVKHILSSLRRKGCNITGDHFKCQPCSQPIGGMFTPENGVILCANNMVNFGNQLILLHTLTHELIHAYDYFNANFDFNNINHVAYSELRAASLSGECFMRLDENGISGLFDGFERCVKRRAKLALDTNPNFSNKIKNSKVVEELYDRAIYDTEPFDTIREFNFI